MTDRIEVEILAASNAADRGLRALADLAAAAAGSNYRVIGGHMVHLLGRLYPTDTDARVTADTDAGMETVAAGRHQYGPRPSRSHLTTVLEQAPTWGCESAVAWEGPSRTLCEPLRVHCSRCVHASHAQHAGG